MKVSNTVCFLEQKTTISNGAMTNVSKTAKGHFAKSWKLMSKLYRIHQMVTQIFYNYESTNFSQNQIVYLFLCTVNVNYLMHIFYWINVLNSSNYLPQWWVEFDNELSWFSTRKFRAFFLAGPLEVLKIRGVPVLMWWA